MSVADYTARLRAYGQGRIDVSHVARKRRREYIANTRAHAERLTRWADDLDAAAAAIRAMLPATEGQLTFGLREQHSASDVVTALSLMVGDRVGAVTEGELVIAGWAAGGHEIYGPR